METELSVKCLDLNSIPRSQEWGKRKSGMVVWGVIQGVAKRRKEDL